MQVMSPPNFTPGRSAVKSRFTGLGMDHGTSTSTSVVTRNGHDWQAIKPLAPGPEDPADCGVPCPVPKAAVGTTVFGPPLRKSGRYCGW